MKEGQLIMHKKALYYKIKIEIELKLKRKLTDKESTLVNWMAEKAENRNNEKCKK